MVSGFLMLSLPFPQLSLPERGLISSIMGLVLKRSGIQQSFYLIPSWPYIMTVSSIGLDRIVRWVIVHWWLLSSLLLLCFWKCHVMRPKGPPIWLLLIVAWLKCLLCGRTEARLLCLRLCAWVWTQIQIWVYVCVCLCVSGLLVNVSVKGYCVMVNFSTLILSQHLNHPSIHLLLLLWSVWVNQLIKCTANKTVLKGYSQLDSHSNSFGKAKIFC